ncbi:hypothetical protein HanIR_Chr01g0050921 [Helianthus annuus]|nr:hypothetical protein HanIR_Chr01g0050921 [Helianthus annuus]
MGVSNNEKKILGMWCSQTRKHGNAIEVPSPVPVTARGRKRHGTAGKRPWHVGYGLETCCRRGQGLGTCRKRFRRVSIYFFVFFSGEAHQERLEQSKARSGHFPDSFNKLMQIPVTFWFEQVGFTEIRPLLL